MEGRFEWFASIDMDEFIYTRRFPTLSDHLNHVDIHHGERKSLVVPWKVFGSNGHIQQPPNVIDHFVARDGIVLVTRIHDWSRRFLNQNFIMLRAILSSPRNKISTTLFHMLNLWEENLFWAIRWILFSMKWI